MGTPKSIANPRAAGWVPIPLDSYFSYGANVSMRRREGWEPVRAEDHPELLLDLGLDGSTPKNGLVLFGGLMLCKNLDETVEKRNRYYENMADQQARSVDNNFMRENDARMPLFSEKRAEVTFGRGN